MKKNKSVTILSTQFAINYGAVLQAFSLQYFLKNNLKIAPKFLKISSSNYRYGRRETYNFKNIKDSILSLVKIFNFLYKDTKFKKIQKFDNFLKKYFEFHNEAFNLDVNNKYLNLDSDYFIVGSDQVWNPDVIDEEIFFLNNVKKPGAKKISYAASIKKNQSKEELDVLAEKIIEFNNISLREDNHIQYLRDYTNKNIVHLIDPVFLTSRAEWKKLFCNNSINLNKPYILIFEVSSPPNFKDVVLEAKKRYPNHCFIEISNRPLPKYSFTTKEGSLSPAEFVNYFDKADFIITSSFHGVAFSTILNKRFICKLDESRSSRQKNILKKFNILNRIIESPSDLYSILNTEVDWTFVNNKIKEESKKSLNYLRESLDHG